MKTQYYSLNKVKKEQARMHKRACRPHLYGQKVTVPTRHGTMGALIYNKKNLHPGYLIVEVHGGGFMYNSAADDDDFCNTIHKKLGIPVISCDYNLSPEHPFPIGLEDVYDCVKFALTLPSLKVQKDKIILWGHSAGANLAAGAAYLAVNAENQDFTPSLLILDYPYMDACRKSEERPAIKYSVSGKLMDTFAHYYTQDTETLKDILISPILHPSQFFRGIPKTFLLLCGRDNLNLGGKEYGKRLRKAGVPVTFYYVKEGLHGFIENHFNYKYIPLATRLLITKKQHRLAEEAVSRICEWIIRETTE